MAGQFVGGDAPHTCFADPRREVTDAAFKEHDAPCLREICDGLPVRHQMVLFLTPLSTCTIPAHPTINCIPPHPSLPIPCPNPPPQTFYSPAPSQ
ncbi:hypothetical protein E2C01_071453 [Portunus trituberculatus]|uniref:Uncharacterized protein n=1 Tax=Portunus trituberculatus TaxID=210409 RepID=A0A5B7I4H4_PORTR|nr:hypothetical protein [Portunus trituberculatus]